MANLDIIFTGKVLICLSVVNDFYEKGIITAFYSLDM